MQEGKAKRMELINELRSTEALQETEARLIKDEKKEALGVQRKQRMMQHKVTFLRLFFVRF